MTPLADLFLILANMVGYGDHHLYYTFRTFNDQEMARFDRHRVNQ